MLACLKSAAGFLLHGNGMININEEQILAERPASVLTSTEDRAFRLSACSSCQEKKQILGVDVCSRCNCALVLRTLIKLAPCPLNKWELNPADLPRAE